MHGSILLRAFFGTAEYPRGNHLVLTHTPVKRNPVHDADKLSTMRSE